MHIIEYLLKNQQNDKTIEDLHRTFETMLLSKASVLQKQSMRLAFFAGVASIMVLLKREIVEGEMSEIDSDKLIQNLNEQLSMFVNQTARNKS